MHLSCTICTELYQVNEEIGVTNCGHIFHIDCVTPWLKNHRTCPHCRAQSLQNQLIRVFFTEVSEADVHLNGKCEVESFKAIIASEREHIKRLKFDLRQSQNDLISMGKHIESYVNEVHDLKEIINSLKDDISLANNEIKKLKEQLSIRDIVAPPLQPAPPIPAAKLQMDEMKRIMTSYEEAMQRKENEIELLQKDLKMAISKIENDNRNSQDIPIDKMKKIYELSKDTTIESFRKVMDKLAALKTTSSNDDNNLITQTSQSSSSQKLKIKLMRPRGLPPPPPPVPPRSNRNLNQNPVRPANTNSQFYIGGVRIHEIKADRTVSSPVRLYQGPDKPPRKFTTNK